MFRQQKGHENRSYRKKTNKGEITDILAIFQNTCHLLDFHRNKNRMIATKSSWISVFIKRLILMSWPPFPVFAEVLLDMNAAGGELGWLTWPLEQADRPGVSAAPSSPLQPPCFCLELTSGYICTLRMHRKGLKRKRLLHKHLTVWLVWLGVRSWCVFMSGCSKVKQQVPHGCWGKRMRRSCLESVLGLQRLVSRKTALYSELEIVVASCGFKASTPGL